MKSIKNNFYMIRLIWRACPLRVVLNMLRWLTVKVGDMVYSIFLLRYIAKAIENGMSFSGILWVLFAVLGYSIIVSIFEPWLSQLYIPKTNVVIQEHLLTKMYKKALECDLSCYENPDFYDKYTRANSEILDRSIKILDNASCILSAVISAVVSVCLIALWEPIAIPIVVVCGVTQIVINEKRSKLKYDCMIETTPQTRTCDYVKRTVYLQDYAKEMRLTNIFAPLLGHFNESVGKKLEITKRYYGKEGFLRVVQAVFMNLGTYLAVQTLIIYRYVVQNAYNLSDVVTILNACGNLQSNIATIAWHLSDFIENGIYVENLRVFFDYETKIKENEQGLIPKNKKHRLTLNNVSFTYEGQDKPVIKNLNLNIEEGQKVALVGHNGAGKSTLVKLIMRLYDVTEGEILLDGVNIKEYKLSDYRHTFGTVFQDFKIFAADIEENVLLHPVQNDGDERTAYNAACDSGLKGKLSELENGMKTQLTREFDDEGTILSGGEYQKIAVARVFAKQSSIAILDEPSSALDPISEYEMFENMMRACADKTVIFISHRLSSAVNADMIYLLEDGEIAESGTHTELMDKNGRYAEMFEMQAKNYREDGDAE